MTPVNLGELRSGRPDCPSDLALDRLVAEAVAPQESTSLREHVEHCDACTERLALRREGFAAFPELDAQKPLAALHRHLQVSQKAGRAGALSAWLAGPRLAFTATGAVALAVLAILLVRAPGGPHVEDGSILDPAQLPDRVRLKGELALHVYRQEGQRAKEAMSGERFRPGDNLRFAVDLARAGHISILGIDAQGKLYTAWPLPEHRADIQKSAGRGQQLEGGVTLDDSLGEESLYLIACPRPEEPSQCRSAGKGHEPVCPAGCASSQFLLKKAP